MVSRDLFESEVWWRGQRTSTSSGECCVGGVRVLALLDVRVVHFSFLPVLMVGARRGTQKTSGRCVRERSRVRLTPCVVPSSLCDTPLCWGGGRSATHHCLGEGSGLRWREQWRGEGWKQVMGRGREKKKMLKHFFVFPPFFFHTTLSHHTVTSPSPSPPHSHTPP